MKTILLSYLDARNFVDNLELQIFDKEELKKILEDSFNQKLDISETVHNQSDYKSLEFTANVINDKNKVINIFYELYTLPTYNDTYYIAKTYIERSFAK